jgi:RHS repeat-associated protein
MVLDQTGNLNSMRRHDYLPFGEELTAPTSGRTTAQGYAGGDGVRQQFTSKERDEELGLDYFEARYYSSMSGRFTIVDPENTGADPADPQRWNGYAYCRSNPLLFVDTDGLDVQVTWDDSASITYTDREFERLRNDLKDQGFIVRKGKIYAPVMDDDNNVIGVRRIGTYSSDCLYCEQLITEMGRRAEPIKIVMEVGFYANIELISFGTGLGFVGDLGLGLRGTAAVARGFTTKAAARAAVEHLAASQAAKAAAKKAISRATSTSTIEVVEEAGTVYVRISRAGRQGHQVIETTIKSDGTKTVVQKAYNDFGKLVHYDPKL